MTGWWFWDVLTPIQKKKIGHLNLNQSFQVWLKNDKSLTPNQMMFKFKRIERMRRSPQDYWTSCGHVCHIISGRDFGWSMEHKNWWNLQDIWGCQAAFVVCGTKQKEENSFEPGPCVEQGGCDPPWNLTERFALQGSFAHETKVQSWFSRWHAYGE